MKTRIKYFLMFFAFLALSLCAFEGPVQAAAQKKTALSDAERALAILEVQNVMSRHAYYHAAGNQVQELLDIWVKKDGKYAKTATFANPQSIMNGYDVIMKNYGVGREEREQKSLENMIKVYPEIKNTLENHGIGHEWVIHTQTTPVIEIAGDGQTAKGFWYSPGIGLSSAIKDRKVSARGTLFMEMYGIDFVKEDGAWKIWHFQTFYDWSPSLPSSMTDNLVKGSVAGSAPAGSAPSGDQARQAAPKVESMEATTAQALPEGYIKNPRTPWQNWSPTRPSVMAPLPEPYYTFSDTFTY
jgi:hypothetical protein